MIISEHIKEWLRYPAKRKIIIPCSEKRIAVFNANYLRRHGCIANIIKGDQYYRVEASIKDNYFIN